MRRTFPPLALVCVIALVVIVSLPAHAMAGGLFLPVVLRIPTPTATATPTRTATATRTATLQATATATRTATATHTPTSQATAMSTSTPTRTVTRTPTMTVTATRTPIPSGGVTVLDNHFSYTSSGDYLYILGEVRNDTSSNVRYVKVSANLYNTSGQILATDFTYAALDVLPPGERTCFDIIVLDPPEGWSYYQFEAPQYSTGGDAAPPLTILSHSGSYRDSYGWYEIVGEIRNDAGVRVEYVSPIATLYNASGTVVGCDYSYVNSTHLDPGQTSAFDILSVGRDYVDVTSYRLQVDGRAK
jgi:hypothetical protein